MAITTKRGDYGETDLMFGRRVPKDHPRVVAVGAIDELNANLGIVRVSSKDVGEITEKIEHIQNDLIILMGEIITLPEDLDLYQEKGFERFEEKRTEILERWIKDIEDKKSDKEDMLSFLVYDISIQKSLFVRPVGLCITEFFCSSFRASWPGAKTYKHM